jgi:hypothetical protein
MSDARGSDRVEQAALLAAIASYLALSLLTLDQMEEDAFIYFRLARNLADGHGYVWNRGGEAIESGSSPLWLLLLVLLARLQVDLVLGAKLLGVAMGVAALVLVHAIARTFIEGRWLRLAPVLLTAWSAPFLAWNQRGLETPLHVLVVLGGSVCGRCWRSRCCWRDPRPCCCCCRCSPPSRCTASRGGASRPGSASSRSPGSRCWRCASRSSATPCPTPSTRA